MDAEPGHVPPTHNIFYQGVIYFSLFLEHLKYVRPEKSCKVIQVNIFGHDVEHAAAIEKTVSHDTMDVTIPSAIIAKGMDSHNRAYDPVLNSGNGS